MAELQRLIADGLASGISDRSVDDIIKEAIQKTDRAQAEVRIRLE